MGGGEVQRFLQLQVAIAGVGPVEGLFGVLAAVALDVAAEDEEEDDPDQRPLDRRQGRVGAVADRDDRNRRAGMFSTTVRMTATLIASQKVRPERRR